MTRAVRRGSARIPIAKVATPTAGSIKRTQTAKDSSAPAELHGPERTSTAQGSQPSLAERLQVERKQLFKAISIIECCKNATATLLEVNDSEYMIPAFEAVCDLLDLSAVELERIVADCETAIVQSNSTRSDRSRQ
ncbi:MAG TPA: hypothetical protein VJS42_08850 [Steroidobacteraceae bacterium]|nr:hypothetical protein [Steroidobacteraceae bacterium]